MCLSIFLPVCVFCLPVSVYVCARVRVRVHNVASRVCICRLDYNDGINLYSKVQPKALKPESSQYCIDRSARMCV